MRWEQMRQRQIGPNQKIVSSATLNLLEKHGKEAIFFVAGEVAQKHPELLDR